MSKNKGKKKCGNCKYYSPEDPEERNPFIKEDYGYCNVLLPICLDNEMLDHTESVETFADTKAKKCPLFKREK